MDCDLLQKIELIHAAGTQIVPKDGGEIVKTLYDILSILDTKGLALLAFDGIVVAATTFAAEKGDVFRKRGPARWLAILVIVVSLSAAALCLGVAEIPTASYTTSSAPRPTNSTTRRRSITSCHWSTGARRITRLPGGFRSSPFRCSWRCSGSRSTGKSRAAPTIDMSTFAALNPRRKAGPIEHRPYPLANAVFSRRCRGSPTRRSGGRPRGSEQALSFRK